ncbi:MAG: hemolysin family protein [Acidobacteria bacterium]|nr:hemolysin family protein [Acidobacteriota bacterium]
MLTRSAALVAATPTGSDWGMLVAIVLLLIVLIFLAAAEMGLSKMTKPKAAAMADQGLKSGRALSRLVEDPARWVNPILLTVNVCQTVQATLTGVVAGRLFGAAGVVIGIAVNVVVFYVLAEAVPKTYAVIYPEKAALLAARPVWTLANFWPLQVVSRGLISLTNVIVKGKGLQQGPFVSEQELLGIVEAAAQDEVIEHEERELIESIIEFGDTVVREVMVPRPDIVTIDHDLTITEALDVAITEGYSRLPVVREVDDDIDVVGITFAKDLMRAERDGRGTEPLSGLVRSVRIVPENKPVSRLMREMQTDKFHMAVVADEHGSIAGIVSLEDCLEELVGEIVDEFDQEEQEIKRMPNGDYLVVGKASVGDVNDLLAIRIPDDDWDTIAGFVFNMLEHVPEPGEFVEHEGWRFAAESVEGRRIAVVRISACPPAD